MSLENWLPSEAEAKKAVEDFEEGIWKDLYHGVESLDEKLAIISKKLQLESPPSFNDDSEKFNYLMKLEDIYYDKVFRECHDY